MTDLQQIQQIVQSFDRFIGAIDERSKTNQVQGQRVIESLDRLDTTVTRLNTQMEGLMPRLAAMEKLSPEKRLIDCEECCKDWKKYKMSVLTALALIGIIALLSGAVAVTNLVRLTGSPLPVEVKQQGQPVPVVPVFPR